tara:strand:- start:554 stop:1396 length:843 start_codon:yes stop_codon:yes gene_type:complete
MSDFLETTEWINLSNKIRKRDQQCLRCGSKHRLCADHIIPRRRRRDLSLAEFNLQTLCWNCNTVKKDKYIVSYLDNPSSQLLNEIDQEKSKIRIALNKIAKDMIYKTNQNKDGFIKKDDFEKVVEGYNVLTLGINHPEQARKEGVFHSPLNILRFFGMGFTLIGSVGLSILKEANDQYGKNKISQKEVSVFIEGELNKIFSDWGQINQTNNLRKKNAEKNNDEMTEEELTQYYGTREKEDPHRDEDLSIIKDQESWSDIDEEDYQRVQEYKSNLHKKGIN